MINAFRVIWRTVKSIWEDMLLLVLMNGFTFLCALPAAILMYFAVALGGGNPLFTLLFTLVVAVPTLIPFAGAWAGLYAVCNRVANGYAISWGYFFEHFKANIWKWWRYVLFAFAVFGLLILNFVWYPMAFPDQAWVSWVQGAFLAALFFWTAIQFYVFPFYMEQETKSWKVALRNAALIAGANPLFTLVLLIVAVVLLGISLLIVPPLFVLLGWLFWVMTGSEAVSNRIKAYRDRLDAEEAKKTGRKPDPRRPKASE